MPSSIQKEPNGLPGGEQNADERSRAIASSRKAIALIDQLRLPPSPENYALFFHFAHGLNPELIREVNHAIDNKIPLTESALKTLYTKYVLSDKNQRLINEVTQGTNRVLGQVLRMVGDFSAETNHFTQDIDTHVTHLSEQIDDPALQSLVKEIVQATAAIKQRSESMQKKLVESRSEIEGLRKNLDQVTQESQRDFLTGVFNRKAMDQVMAELLAHPEDAGKDMSLLMIDVDHFKKFNDKFGHLLGDEVLKIVARAITYCVRGKDVVARFGGEEFCVLLPGTPLAGAAKVAETIRTTIASRDLKRKDTGESFGSVTVSLGASQFKPGDTPETLVKRADEALYKSKREGRNRVTLEGA